MALGRVVVNKVGAPGIIRLVPVRKRHVVGLRTLNVAAMGIPVSGGRERGARASERGGANRGVLRDASLLGARDAVPRMLELFAPRDIRATWATVGFLFCETKDGGQRSLVSVPATA